MLRYFFEQADTHGADTDFHSGGSTENQFYKIHGKLGAGGIFMEFDICRRRLFFRGRSVYVSAYINRKNEGQKSAEADGRERIGNENSDDDQ